MDNQFRQERSSVWDAHVHCYPEEVIADPSSWAREMGEQHWLELVTNGPQGWAGPDDFIRQMDEDGIEKVLLQAWYWENPQTAHLQNEWHAEWLKRYPDRFMACACIHPDMEEPVRELESARDWGAVGVGECLPQVQCREGWAHPHWDTIIEWTTSAGWPICLHVTEQAGHDYPGKVDTPLNELLHLFGKHPQQKWLCAHWGGGLPYYALNAKVRKLLANVWFDSAAGPLLYDARIWRSVVDLVGPDKVVFGSDFPLLIYPGKDKQPGWRRFLDELQDSGLDAGERAAVSVANLAGLLPD
ncbi:MAG: amidohydrolase family protein [Puniceicoccaceae bacterium]